MIARDSVSVRHKSTWQLGNIGVAETKYQPQVVDRRYSSSASNSNVASVSPLLDTTNQQLSQAALAAFAVAISYVSAPDVWFAHIPRCKD